MVEKNSLARDFITSAIRGFLGSRAALSVSVGRDDADFVDELHPLNNNPVTKIVGNE